MDPSKIEVVAEWKWPQSVTDIRSFLGLARYYHRFIKNFSKIVKPMTELLHKNAPFVWNEAHEQSFQELKKHLMTTPILALPDIR
jgi:trans-aconitate methyltransferase